MRIHPALKAAVNRITIDGDLKDAAMSSYQCGSKAEIILDRGRQTGCRRKETSFHTVGDLDGHGFLSFVIHAGLSRNALDGHPSSRLHQNNTVAVSRAKAALLLRLVKRETSSFRNAKGSSRASIYIAPIFFDLLINGIHIIDRIFSIFKVE